MDIFTYIKTHQIIKHSVGKQPCDSMGILWFSKNRKPPKNLPHKTLSEKQTLKVDIVTYANALSGCVKSSCWQKALDLFQDRLGWDLQGGWDPSGIQGFSSSACLHGTYQDELAQLASALLAFCGPFGSFKCVKGSFQTAMNRVGFFSLKKCNTNHWFGVYYGWLYATRSYDIQND